MSTCAQNNSNQDEDGPGAESNEGNSHEAAAQHFLSASQASNGPASRSNGMPSQPTRGMPVRARVRFIFVYFVYIFILLPLLFIIFVSFFLI